MSFSEQGEAKSAQLIGDAISNNPAFITLRKIEASREIANTVSNSANRILLNTEGLMLNLEDLPIDVATHPAKTRKWSTLKFLQFNLSKIKHYEIWDLCNWSHIQMTWFQSYNGVKLSWFFRSQRPDSVSKTDDKFSFSLLMNNPKIVEEWLPIFPCWRSIYGLVTHSCFCVSRYIFVENKWPLCCLSIVMSWLFAINVICIFQDYVGRNMVVKYISSWNPW